ncbi:sensor histidine kinase [Thiomicrorhabdus arctica]|uniref:sensor histidine kinase n=1 Tax=Thiomicrorhabdus arctica TaxID=131540 RepID=UPI00036AAAE3|nr:sensor histidine kinase [Thiomicrorhabdus arctica]
MNLFLTKSRSLKKQLSTSLVVSILGILSLFWWLSESTIHHITEDYLLTGLAHDAQTIEHNLHLKDGVWTLKFEDLEPIYSRLNTGHYFVIKTATQSFHSPSLGDYPLYLKPFKSSDTLGVTNVYETRGPVEDLVLVRSVQLRKDNQPIDIYVVEDHTPIQTLLLKFDLFFGLFTILTLISLYFLHQWLIKRAFNQLAPLESILRDFNLGHKVLIKPEDYPVEVQALIESLNSALEQSSLQFQKSRQFNGNLSHSLKTPLNLIFQLLDAPELKKSPLLLQNLKHQSQNILALTERELKADRIAQHQVITPISLNELMEDLIPSFEQLYRDKSIRFELNIPPTSLLSMEKEDAFELLGNLVDNACKWCNTTVAIHYDHHQLVIEDDGPGATPGQLTLVAERGYRTDETKPGHGIGLSIVKELMVAYQAEILFSHSELGGLKVQITFS